MTPFRILREIPGRMRFLEASQLLTRAEEILVKAAGEATISHGGLPQKSVDVPLVFKGILQWIFFTDISYGFLWGCPFLWRKTRVIIIQILLWDCPKKTIQVTEVKVQHWTFASWKILVKLGQ